MLLYSSVQNILIMSEIIYEQYSIFKLYFIIKLDNNHRVFVNNKIVTNLLVYCLKVVFAQYTEHFHQMYQSVQNSIFLHQFAFRNK